MKIAFDVGGVLSKYPQIFRPLLEMLHRRGDDPAYRIECWVISDMHPVEKIIDMLKANQMPFLSHRVRSANYALHGEACKAVLCKDLGIDILVDDFIGYVATPGSPLIRLLLMPDPSLPYYHDSWWTDGSEGDFGRRKKP